MPTRNNYLRQAQECAAMAEAAQWPETRSVWRQMERLYLVLASHDGCVAAGINFFPRGDNDGQ